MDFYYSMTIVRFFSYQMGPAQGKKCMRIMQLFKAHARIYSATLPVIIIIIIEGLSLCQYSTIIIIR